MSDCDDIEKKLAAEQLKIRKRLEKLTLYRVSEWTDVGFQKTATVIYAEDGKIKLGVISDPFVARYGISVWATYKGGEAWWFQIAGAASLDDMSHMRRLFDREPLPFPIISVDDLTLRG